MVENEQLKQDNDRFVGIEQKLRTVEGERDGSKKIIREK
jgi:archaellum component FlaC